MANIFRPVHLAGLLAICVSGGCEFKRTSSLTAPTPAPVAPASSSSLVGVWTSEGGSALVNVTPAANTPALNSCTQFRWEVPAQTGQTASGPFSVVCAGPITLTGTATGLLLSPTSLKLDVAGTANLPGIGNCVFSLGGTGVLDGDSLRIPYTGVTCLGAVSGNETLRRNQPSAPPPPAEPPPPPPPPPPAPEPPAPPAPPSNSCASNNGDFIADCIAARYPDYLRAGVSSNERISNMEFLRDRMLEAGRCGGLDLAWNLKRGVGPRSTDALAWRHANGFVDVVDIGSAYDDTSQPLQLQWLIVAGPPGYDGFPNSGCQ